MPIKNYVYACRPLAPEDEFAALAQMRAAHAYRNKLCEIELERRAAYHAILEQHCPDYVAAKQAVAEAEAAIEQKIAAIRAVRAKHRAKGSDAEKELKKEITAATETDRDRLKELRAARKLAKDAAFERAEFAVAVAALDGEYKARRKAAYNSSAAHWGTRLVVAQAASSFVSGAPPRFQRWSGEGAIAVQIQSGMSVESLYTGRNSSLAMQQLPLPAGADPQSKRSQRRRHCALAIRTGSQPGSNKPVWTRFRVLLHRPLPPGGAIKWCKVFRRLVGTQVEWRVMFVVETPPEDRPAAPGRMVAVHAGWRKLPDGNLRVAVWRGSDGRSGELTIAHQQIESLDHVDALRSICDRAFDTAKARLKIWSAAFASRGGSLPSWLSESLATLHAWRSHKRLAEFAERWSASGGFPGDEKIVRWLLWWRVRQDRHLHNWLSHRRLRVTGRRDDAYRCLAQQLATEYSYVALLDVDWKKLLEKSTATEDDNDAPAIVRRYARMASPGRLHQFLRERFGESSILEVNPAYVTNECHHCHKRGRWNRQRLRHQCSGCFKEWDQDENAAMNQLARGEEAIKERESLASQAGPEDAPQQGAKKISARQQRFIDARERARKAKEGNASA